MAIASVEVVRSAAGLPAEWDVAAGDRLALRRDTLLVLEQTNPCGQLYHVTTGAAPRSIAVTYRHRLNLLTFGRGALRMPVTIVGIPCSVSSPGCHLAADTENAMLSHLRAIPGAKLMLNTGREALAGFGTGATLPSCRLDIRWDSFADYLAALRSHYRYRLTRAQSSWAGVAATAVTGGDFGDDLYGLYLNVYRRSRYKLEKLDIGFFRRFPAQITAFMAGPRPIAFVQTVRNGDELVFMFGGMDYSAGNTYDTYLNMLLHIVREAISGGRAGLDLGQTAEETKVRLGCRLVRKHLHAAHSNGIAHKFLAKLAGALAYKLPDSDHHVFR